MSVSRAIQQYPPPNTIMRVFISYEDSGSLIARRLCDMLTEHDAVVFFAQTGLSTGESIVDRISIELTEADVFILLWSRYAATSRWVRQELSAVLQAYADFGKPTIFPVCLDDTPIPMLANHFKSDALFSHNDLESLVDAVVGYRGNSCFDYSITHALRRFGRTVRQMTTDQCRIIEILQHHKRVAIKGCAGSGKTLVAAEQAIRFAHAGLRTLLLCHNPILAGYLRELTRGSGVEVWSISQWIDMLTKMNATDPAIWSKYAEPTAEALEAAASALGIRRMSYESIVVDEGQDFRDDWWVLLELALAAGNHSRLHIFYDDNQMLLPFRGNCPIDTAPFVLSRNVRNGGTVFNLMSVFHPCLPEPEVGLLHKGEVMLHAVRRKEKAIRKLKWVVAKRLQQVPMRSVTVLIPDSNQIDSLIESIFRVDGPTLPLFSPKFRPFGQGEDGIAVHGIDSFKGMESDVVVLFLESTESIAESHLYVAVSRARLFLDIVADPDIVSILKSRCPHLTLAGIKFALR